MQKLQIKLQKTCCMYVNFYDVPDSAKSISAQFTDSVQILGCQGHSWANPVHQFSNISIRSIAENAKFYLFGWLSRTAHNQFLIGLLVFFYMTYQVTILQTCERENTVHLIPSVFDKLICQKGLKNGPVVEKKAQGLSRTALRRAVRGQRQRWVTGTGKITTILLKSRISRILFSLSSSVSREFLPFFHDSHPSGPLSSFVIL